MARLLLLAAFLLGPGPFAASLHGQVDGRSMLSKKPVTHRPVNVAHDPFAHRIAEKLPRPVVKYAPGQLPGQAWVPGRRSLLVVAVALALVSATIYLFPRLD